MNVVSEKEQYRKRIKQVEFQIKRQERRVKKAKRRYHIKDEWVLSFWIWNNSSLCKTIWMWELDMYEALKEYKEMLEIDLINL